MTTFLHEVVVLRLPAYSSIITGPISVKLASMVRAESAINENRMTFENRSLFDHFSKLIPITVQ